MFSRRRVNVSDLGDPESWRLPADYLEPVVFSSVSEFKPEAAGKLFTVMSACVDDLDGLNWLLGGSTFGDWCGLRGAVAGLISQSGVCGLCSAAKGEAG